ncbi:CAP domain-containing protein [Kitasatospora azatica]|uniref:CAP domain-containing protein n=1 Tax=Kitasatospora azatica TaxID=58347 RepID=UPI00069166BD|nr:CAP domain-containing protein [Kitasatospora azatica]
MQRVLALINQARAAHGLPAYTITAGLTTSAQTHNQVMAGGCGLSHQCPGEPGLGARVTAQGVQWTAVGENIGYGGPVSTAAQDTAAQAVGLTKDMLNEQPPNDGHRRNILSSSFTHIGIAVYRDANGTVWLTQDFSS